MSDLCELAVEKIIPPAVLLRQVKPDSVEYLELKDSIESKGLLNSISVRPSKRFPGKYEIIDGMYRWTCVKEIGLPTIPAVIKHGVEDIDVLILQIQANAIRPTTSPCDFARQLKRIQKENPQITVAQIAAMVFKSPMWVQQQLGLLDLQRDQQKMVDRGEICLQNAYMLAKIPDCLRKHYVDRAKVMKANEFTSLAAGVVKQFRESVRQGKMDAFFTEHFQPQAYLRPLKEIQAELHAAVQGPLMLATENCRTAIDGWNAALRWVLHLDRDSVQKQEAAVKSRIRTKWES